MTFPVWNFSIAGLYSDIVKVFRFSNYPRLKAISSISWILKPNAGQGSLTPGTYYALIDEMSKHAIKSLLIFWSIFFINT